MATCEAPMHKAYSPLSSPRRNGTDQLKPPTGTEKECIRGSKCTYYALKGVVCKQYDYADVNHQTGLCLLCMQMVDMLDETRK